MIARGLARLPAPAVLLLGLLLCVPALAGVVEERRDAARLLTQATFGPTMPEITRAARIGPAAWIDQEIARQPTYIYPLWRDRDIATNGHGEMQSTWYEVAVTAPDQLRQRMAFAFSEILVVSAQSDIDPRALVGYYDILVRHSLGNFRTLLERATLSMAMGRYLSMYRNRKPDPAQGIRADENFAREIMQLFTIGLVQLNPDGTPRLDELGQTTPTYRQRDIENLARVFTGWGSDNVADFYAWPPDWAAPMIPYEDFHDTDAKRILGRSFPAGRTARAELRRILDILFAHPNTGPFIARQLIQRLVTSNPSPAYVGRVAAVFADNGAGVRGDLAAVARAILLDVEARNGNVDLPGTFGKVREPILRVTHLWRAFGGVSQRADGRFPPIWTIGELGQGPLWAPSVFNFYSPSYSPDGELRDSGLVAPEMALANDSLLNRSVNYIDGILWNFTSNPYVQPNPEYPFVSINIDTEAALASDTEALLDRLDLLLMSGQMPESMRESLRRRLPDWRYEWDERAAWWRVRGAVYLIVNSPQYLVQK